ncbi:MAG: hypothetical protein MUF05_07420 [Candidatus Omnitrophica bacterium]|jgi:hypothetical protein|nr:hypothetical protein [Candidatus Omnitrophota bacterium]
MDTNKRTQEKIGIFFSYIFIIFFAALIVYGLFQWSQTTGLKSISTWLSNANTRISKNFGAVELNEIINNLRPFLSLIWNICLIFGLSLIVIGFNTRLFEKLRIVCEKKQYGDFYKTYIRGLKTVGHLSLLLLPLAIWIFMWIIGNALDQIFCSYSYYSVYTKENYTSHHNWIMVILGLGSIPFLIALYFPIIKGVKRHFKENKGKRLLLDIIEDFERENEKLKERINSFGLENTENNE